MELFDLSLLGHDGRSISSLPGALLTSVQRQSVMGTDLDGRIFLRREGARRVYGYGPKEVAGQAELRRPVRAQRSRSDSGVHGVWV